MPAGKEVAFPEIPAGSCQDGRPTDKKNSSFGFFFASALAGIGYT
jgi:hypothetical protein